MRDNQVLPRCFSDDSIPKSVMWLANRASEVLVGALEKQQNGQTLKGYDKHLIARQEQINALKGISDDLEKAPRTHQYILDKLQQHAPYYYDYLAGSMLKKLRVLT